MAPRKIRVGLVGASVSTDRWGGRIHGPVFQTLPETELVAVCTSRPETARVAAQAFGVRHAFADYRQMVQLDEVDLVSVALRVDMHHPVVEAALEAGKHVFCEWPLAVTSHQAQEMYTLATAKGLHHAVGLQARCTPAVMYLRDLIAQGYIGQPLAVNVMHTHDRGFWRKWSHAMFLEKREGGGNALTIFMGHALDAALYCVGELDSLCADVGTLIKEGTLADTGERFSITAPDNVTLSGRLKNGAMLTAQVSWTADPPLGWQLYAYGTEGCLIATSDGNYHFKGITLRGARRSSTRDGSRGQREDDKIAQPLAVPAHYNWTPEFPEDASQFNVAQLVRRLARGIREGEEVSPDFRDGVSLHHLLDTIERASRTRRWVRLAPTRTSHRQGAQARGAEDNPAT